MANSLAPGFIKLAYASAYGEHIATIGCQPFLSLGLWELDRAGVAVSQLWTTCVDNYVAVAKVLLATTSTFTTAELWTVDAPGDDPQFRAVHELGVVGTAVGATVPASQLTLSYRSTNGGIGKVVLLDQVLAVNLKGKPTAYINATSKAWADFVTSSSTWITARDNGFAFAGIRMRTKTNDVLRDNYGL